VATEKTTTYAIGLVPPFDLTSWSTESSNTAQSPLIGPAVPDSGVYPLGTLATSGTSTAGASIQYRIHAPGFPARRRGGAAGWLWRRVGDDRYHGSDLPWVIEGFEPVSIVDGSSGVLVSNQYPSCICLESGVVLHAAQTTTTTPSTSYSVRVAARSADGLTQGTYVTVYTQTASPTYGLRSCMVQLPSGRVLLFITIEDGSIGQIIAYASDDDGATWSTWSQACLTDPLDISGSGFSFGRITAAYLNGQISLFWEVRSTTTTKGATYMHDTLAQYASIDNGGTFDTVGTLSVGGTDNYGAAVAGARPSLVVFNGSLILNWVAWSGSVATRRYAELATAFDEYATAPGSVLGSPAAVTRVAEISVPGGGTSYQIDDSDLAAVVHQGVLYQYYRDTSDGEMWQDRTRDVRSTWSLGSYYVTSALGQNIWENGVTTTYPRYFAGVSWRGCVLLCHQWAASPGNEDNSIAYMRLGGWTKVSWPLASVDNLNNDYQGGWDLTYLPYDLPGDSGWTPTGAATQSLDAGALHITAAGTLRWYEQTTLSTSVETGVLIRGALQVVSGGSTAANEITIASRVDDGATGVEIQVRFSTTGYQVYDVNAAANVGTAQTIDMTDGIEILIHMCEAGFVTAHRTRDGASGKDFVIGASGTLDTTSTGAVQRVRFGHPTAANGESNWWELHYATRIGRGLVGYTTSPTYLRPGRLLSDPAFSYDGIEVAGIGGPFAMGETWTSAPRYPYPSTDILFADAPGHRKVFKSVTGSPPAAQVFAWRFTDGYSTARLSSTSIALILRGCNWRTATLARYRGGAWSTLASIDLATGLTSLPYTRTGDTITVDTGGSSTAPWYMHRNALVGATVDLGSSKRRLVSANTDGAWTTAGTLKRPVLVLAGVDDTEPSSGTCNIWMPGGAIVIHTASTDQEAAGYRLTIASQSTVSGAIECKAHLGPLVTTFSKPASQRTQRRMSNLTERGSDDGDRNRTTRGPAAGSKTIAFVDGHSTAAVGGSAPSPDYHLYATSARPGDSKGAESGIIEGIMQDCDEFRLPLGWIGYVPVGSASPSVHHILRPDLSIVGLVEPPEVRIETFQWAEVGTAQEWEGEMQRVAELTIVEVP